MSWSTPPARRSYPCRGDYLKFLREKRGWTQEMFAEMVGYSPRLIRKAEGSASLNPETIADLAEALGAADDPVFPEDIVSDPLAAAKLFVESYDQHEHGMLAYCGHLLAEDFVFWCAGADQEMPFAGTYYGAAGFQEFLDRFFAIVTRPKLQPFLPTYTLAGNEVVARYEEHSAINGVQTPPIWIVNISKFQRGKIVRMENYFDTHTGQRIIHDLIKLRTELAGGNM